jgi:hypothetical protein
VTGPAEPSSLGRLAPFRRAVATPLGAVPVLTAVSLAAASLGAAPLRAQAPAFAAPRPCGAPAPWDPLEKDRGAPGGPGSDAARDDAGEGDAVRVLAGPGFGLVSAAPGLTAAGCAPPPVAFVVLTRAVLAAQDALGTDADLAIVLTTGRLACSNIYYAPLANDIRGIGYAHTGPHEVFDETPLHRLEGIAFLNDWPYWQTHMDELESAFDHEIGHRWGARVHADVRGVSSALLLGREQSHWSYYLDTGGSPLEGNVWRGGPTLYVSETPPHPKQFSPLDLYAMGVAPPEQVPPVTLLLDAGAHSSPDCRGAPPSAASPPQTCGPLELAADSVWVTAEDVIGVEGPREPMAEAVPRDVRVLVLMLHSMSTMWNAADCESAARALRERISQFERATSGLLRLQNVLADTPRDDWTCDGLVRAASDLETEGVHHARSSSAAAPLRCALSTDRAPARRASALVYLVIGCAAWLRRARRR